MARPEDHSIGFLRRYATVNVIPEEHRAQLSVAADHLESALDEIEQKTSRILELENALQYLQSRFLIHADYCKAIHRRTDLYGDIAMPVCNKCGQRAPSHDFGCDGEWTETTKGAHHCENCEGIDPDSCINSPELEKSSVTTSCFYAGCDRPNHKPECELYESDKISYRRCPNTMTGEHDWSDQVGKNKGRPTVCKQCRRLESDLRLQEKVSK